MRPRRRQLLKMARAECGHGRSRDSVWNIQTRTVIGICAVHRSDGDLAGDGAKVIHELGVAKSRSILLTVSEATESAGGA